jgi:hypothetical protein
MNASPDRIESEMIDLNGITLAALRSQSLADFAPSLRHLLVQIERPRVNFNDGGPRAD